jgi:hypothetical protein
MSKKPDQKKPKRYPPGRIKHPPIPTNGSYETGVTEPKMAAILGQMATYWPQVEDAMIDLFHDLVGGQDELASRLIFKTLINPQARIKVLKRLLERSPLNKDKGAAYDEVIKQFSDLNDARNSYLHGLWQTFEDKRTFLAELSLDEDYFMHQREVTHDEIEAVFNRMLSLRATIRMKQFRR